MDLFHKRLQNLIGQFLGEDAHVWRDVKLGGDESIEAIKSDYVQGARAFLCVLSPSFVKSAWCKEELRIYLDELTEPGPVLKAIKLPVQLDKQPDAIRNLKGYEFFELDEDRKVPRQYRPDSDKSDLKKYWQRIEELAYDIIQRLAESTPVDTTKQKGVVFVAATTEDARERQRKLAREVEAHGFKVVPDRPLAHSLPKLEEAVNLQLAGAKAAVFVVGDTYGLVPEGSTESMLKAQYRLASKRAREDGLPCLVWMPRDAKFDERQQLFVDEVRKHAPYVETFENDLESFKSAVLKRLSIEPPPVAPAQGPAPASVYLINCEEDAAAADPIAKLIEQRGLAVLRMNGEYLMNIDEHRARVLSADALLLYWGRATAAWVRCLLDDLTKARGYGRARPFDGRALYLAKQRPRVVEGDDVADPDYRVVREERADALNSYLDSVKLLVGLR